MPRKILFTSPVQPIGGCSPDVYSWNKSTSRIKLIMSFINHPGLCFLKANVPGVDILEYPTWSDFKSALRKPPDTLGISFYINETEIALQMVRYARQQGVKEVWAGNYGAYSPEVAKHFDRVITGWGEAPAAAALGFAPKKSSEITHPPMYGCMGTNLFPYLTLHGFLYTSRGCPYTCTFCQTPDFYGEAQTVSLETIEQVLWTYSKHGIATANILDENFGIFPKHTREVIHLLKKYRMRWIPLCRVDLLLKHLEEWKEHGLFGAHIGVETLNPSSLKGSDKKLERGKSVELLRLMSKNHLIVQAFYIIGFEEDTVDSIRQDIEELAALDVDITQVQIVTPYPRTVLRDAINQRYGIIDSNLSKYNSRNLVWRHPNIDPGEIKQLQEWAHTRLFTSSRALRTISKMLVFDCTQKVAIRGVSRMARSRKSLTLYRANRRGLKNAKKWAKQGWYAYDEVENHQITNLETIHRLRSLSKEVGCLSGR
jgi:radical SAM superfamily enzyme YgiQ (UPF0313 family)